jgi:hypothetical protein
MMQQSGISFNMKSVEQLNQLLNNMKMLNKTINK